MSDAARYFVSRRLLSGWLAVLFFMGTGLSPVAFAGKSAGEVPILTMFANPVPTSATINIIPKTAAIGTPRTIMISAPACITGIEVVPALTGPILYLRSQGSAYQPCPERTTSYAMATYTPTAPGTLMVFLLDLNGQTMTYAGLDTIAGQDAHSAANVTGMWYDPATEGSGIALHHRSAGNDAVFGSWFMFGNMGIWYSLQNMVWTQAGNVLEGVALYVGGEGWPLATSNCGDTTQACPPLLSSLVPHMVMPQCGSTYLPCPKLRNSVLPRGTVRITFSGKDRALAEGFDLTGKLLFTSNLVRSEI